MKKLLKKLGALLLCLVFVFSLAACGDKTPTKDDPDDPTVDPPPTQTDPVPPELSELIDDEYATAERGDKPEVPRFPEDEEWKQLLEKQQAIEAGEKFTETFDGTYFTSRLSAVSDGASFETIEGSDAIEGKSLRITTEGNYAGIRLTGAKFIAGATYTVKMDYNVITPSDDFFFQFRDATAGSVSDLFTTFGATAGKGSIEHTFTLGMYSGYYIMIMPRTKAGELVIDNIEITRDDSRPMASEVSLKGEVAVGSTVEASYVYSDYENDLEGESEIRWFTALTDTGMNKMMLDNTGKTLEITEDMNGKYIGFQVIPKSQGENSTGVPVLFMATETVGGGRPDYGEKFSLEPGESFTETFEADTGEDKNLIYVPHGNTDNYIYKDADRNSNVLRIKSDGAYYGTDFTGISFTKNWTYTISFDYAFVTVPNTFYVQLRSTMGDSFYQIPTEDAVAGKWEHISGELTVGNADDAFLMMFPDATAVEILIDNLTITRAEPPEDNPPTAIDLSLEGELTIGSTLTAHYTYQDSENDPEGESEIQWFAGLSDTGKNKTLLDNEGSTLVITEDLAGMYIGFQVIPKAASGSDPVGSPVLLISKDKVGDTQVNAGEAFTLAVEESFTEDFEATVGQEKNLLFVPHGDTDDYIYYDAARSSNVLRIASEGGYLGTDFEGITFEANATYRISFEFTFEVIPDTFYVQIRANGQDSFFQLPTDQPAGVWQQASGELTVKDSGGYLMMFTQGLPVQILVDNLKIERIA